MKTAEEILEILNSRRDTWCDLQRQAVERNSLLTAAKYQIKRGELTEVIIEITEEADDEEQEG